MRKTYTFTETEYVRINGFSGYVDFINREVVVVRNYNNEVAEFTAKQVKEVEYLGNKNKNWDLITLK